MRKATQVKPTYDEGAAGIEMCVENASKLCQEATLLLSHDHHERAFFLATIACEEVGKAQLIFQMCVTGEADTDKLTHLWQSLFDHKTKQVYFIVQRWARMADGRGVEAVREEMCRGGNGSDVTLESVKQSSLYVNWSDRAFELPSVSTQLAGESVTAAEEMVSEWQQAIESKDLLAAMREAAQRPNPWSTDPVLIQLRKLLDDT